MHRAERPQFSLTLVSVAAALAVVVTGCSGDDSATASDSATGTTVGTATVTASATQGTTATTTTTTGTSATTMSSASEGSSTSTTTESTGPVTATDPTTSTTDPTTSTTEPTSGTSTTGMFCEVGSIVCEDGTAKTCDGMGGFSAEEVCENVCVDGVGCLFCEPGSTRCDGENVEVCNDEGDAWVPGDSCDELQGLSCVPDFGACVGACADLGLSYVGCDYYPTVLQQHDSYNTAPGNVYSIAVANTTGDPATITVTQGDNQVALFDVPASSVIVQNLPWVNALTKGKGPTVAVTDGAYRVRSTVPVTVYQFNPLQSTTTNDASLLLPVNTWRNEYVVAAWPHWINSYPGFYAVVAQKDETTVTVTPSATGKNVQAGAGIGANGEGVVTLNEGDVLQVMSSSGDVTGTIVSADKPIQVFGGHECTNVPLNVSACDHLEESMFPIDTLAKEYVVAPPVQVPNSNLDKAQVIRVIATEDDTTLTFDPDQPVNKSLANAGDYVEMSLTTAAFKVSSDKKIMVSQYMVGQSANYGTSDPSMVLAVPTEQYRTDYLFYAAPSWTKNYVDVIGPNGVTATVDGGAVMGWKPIGNSGFSVAHVELDKNLPTHTVEGDQKVGITVYGVQSSGSYWFPGGLDLDIVPQ